MLITQIPEISSSLSEEDMQAVIEQYANDFSIAALLSLLEHSILETNSIGDTDSNQNEMYLEGYVRQSVYSGAIRWKVKGNEQS
jgi:hypothetical protein